MSAQDEFNKAVPIYATGEKCGDQFIKALCKAMIQTLRVQDECADDDDHPVHPIHFGETKAKLGEAIAAATGAVNALAEAHVLGQAACMGTDDKPGPVTQGGGGGK